LLLLWSYSLLGGQASLRALERMDQVTRNTTYLRYLFTDPVPNFKPNRPGVAGFESMAERVNALYTSVLMAARNIKLAPRDNWGNVRVPQLALLPTAAGADLRDWVTVPSAAERPGDFSSMVGIPTIGLPPRHRAKFSLDTSYLTLSCSPWQQFPLRSDAWFALLGQVWKQMLTGNWIKLHG
jgi:hypothetical protein